MPRREPAGMRQAAKHVAFASSSRGRAVGWWYSTVTRRPVFACRVSTDAREPHPGENFMTPVSAESRNWPSEGLARVPYWIYRDEAIYRSEQERIFRGATWNFLGLEAELPRPGDFKTTFVGELPVVVTRDEKGELRAFENRCAHRGALLCIGDRGNAREFTCVYHNWTYDLQGNLTGVAFRRGVQGRGGLPPGAKPESGAPRKLRLATYCGLVFGTLSDATPPLESYLGEEI